MDMGKPEDVLDVMCDTIVARYHASLHDVLPRIRAALEAQSGVEPSAALSQVRQAFADLADQILAHLAKEETLLFPALQALARADPASGERPRLAFATVVFPIRMMEAEHVRIEKAMDHLRALAREVTAPDSAAAEWHACLKAMARLDAELREHHRTENELLFPLAVERERELL